MELTKVQLNLLVRASQGSCFKVLYKSTNDQLLSQSSEMRNYTAKCGRIMQNAWVLRRSHQRCSIKKAGFKNCAIFTGKHLHWSSFLIKLQNFTPTTLLKTKLQHRCLPVNIANFLRTAILKKICKSLLLSVSRSGYLSENTPKRLLKSNFAQIFIYTICFKDNNF